MSEVKGLLIRFKIGDGESPEQFVSACSITAKSIDHQGTEQTFAIPNCEDEDAVDWLVSEIQNKRIVITGSGTLNGPDYDDFYEWWDSGANKNCQVIIDIPAASGGRVLDGAFKCPNFQLVGNKGELSTVSITVGSSGPVTKSNNT